MKMERFIKIFYKSDDAKGYTTTGKTIKPVTRDSVPHYLVKTDTTVFKVNDENLPYIRKIVVEVTISKLGNIQKTKYYVIAYLHIITSVAIIRDIIFGHHQLTDINQIAAIGVEKVLKTFKQFLDPKIQKVNVCVKFDFFTQNIITNNHKDFLDQMKFFKKVQSEKKLLCEKYYNVYEGDYEF